MANKTMTKNTKQLLDFIFRMMFCHY